LLTLASASLPSKAQVIPPFRQCPSVGVDSGCAILIIITDTGINVAVDPSQGPFDQIEDTLIGVQNNSHQTLFSLPLSSPNPIFGFDGDGLCGVFPHPPGCPFGPTSYEGPSVTFTSINTNQTAGVVNFLQGIPPGGTAYFSLELSVQPLCNPISGVPLIKQSEATVNWRTKLYDNGDDSGTATIGQFGCFLTSTVMLINYYASRQGSTFRTTPPMLNDWLTGQSDGYSPALSGNLNPWAVARYARNVGNLQMYYLGRVDHADDFAVDNFLCNNDPPILKVLAPSGEAHFVVATGQTTVFTTLTGHNTFLINDPGYPRTTLADYNFQYLGVRKFSAQSTPPHGLVITGHSPIELLLTDPAGNKTGFDPTTGQVLHGIPASSYGAESLGDDVLSGPPTPDIKLLEVPTPASGTYSLLVEGTGTGPYSLGFLTYDQAGTPTIRTFDGTTVPGAITRYSISYSSSVGSTPVITRIVTIADIRADLLAAAQQRAIDNQGVFNSLISKLDAAAAALSRGDRQAFNGIIGAFVNEVTAQSGQHIRPDTANLLISDAQMVLK